MVNKHMKKCSISLEKLGLETTMRPHCKFIIYYNKKIVIIINAGQNVDIPDDSLSAGKGVK